MTYRRSCRSTVDKPEDTIIEEVLLDGLNVIDMELGCLAEASYTLSKCSNRFATG